MIHASRGTREIDGNAHPLDDEGVRSACQTTGTRIRVQTVIVAALVTALTLLLPG